VNPNLIQSTEAERYPETAKFLVWYEKERQAGLVDVKFFPKDIAEATTESFFAEVNEALSAEENNVARFL